MLINFIALYLAATLLIGMLAWITGELVLDAELALLYGLGASMLGMMMGIPLGRRAAGTDA